MIVIREIDPADLALFDEWYDAFHAGAVAGREAALVESREALGYSLRNPGPLKTRRAVGAFEDDRVLGAMLFEYRLADNLDAVEVEIDVPPQHRRRGIGTALWQWAVTRSSQLGRTIVQTELGVPADPWPGAEFAARLGFAVEHVEEHFVVPLPYDELRLEELRSAGRPDGYRLTSWAGVCPPEHQQAYADLHSAMDLDVPTGGMTREVVPWTVEKLETSEARVDRNYLALVTMAHTFDGAPAGYTLIYLPRADAGHAQQDDTLVLREHRGHNLGTHLKLANLAQLAEHRTTQRFLHTWTALTNAPMRKVNARFGFRAVEQHRELELELPRLRPAARGVIVDPADRVLLVRFEFADGPVWATPGGGLEPGETVLEGLRRELVEEVGLRDFPDPPHLWHEEHVAEGHATGYDGVLNDYFLIRTDAFDPAGSLGADELRAENVHALRWWTPDELDKHDTRFAPADLPALLRDTLHSGPPLTPRTL
ncbi:bifunctional GNAT family N-acetyltransferase/NUDIX hydrolase [Kribbella sp.]|uniref:bifunctional GNAT family N-acetyltransferase/NUDIX hydrolase n=1 Tax=Kribbella sp. TaxID=1871183 RepID=UPI002D65DCA3|nr:bifunctional GNAT family N-acetyltransferase/NUDIX hydrolase [Kribbella sp.]HZX07440.1 bifunctional GNAT family N-acetyltransferase/NUDIX hydrolase [Kribbella sp.]